jgi:hypothetical protein
MLISKLLPETFNPYTDTDLLYSVAFSDGISNSFILKCKNYEWYIDMITGAIHNKNLVVHYLINSRSINDLPLSRTLLNSYET